MTLVDDGRPGARQRETLRRVSLSPHLSGCAPRTPENPGSHCSRGRSRRPEMLSRVSGYRTPECCSSASQGRHGPSQTSSSKLSLPCPICIPKGRGYGGSRTKVPETESFPELPWPRNKMPKSVKNLLPVFHFGVCVCFSHPAQTLPERGSEKVGGGTEQSSAPNRLWLSGSRGAPAQPCAAERGVGSAGPGPLACPRNYWFLPRLVPFIDSAVPSAGVTTGQTLFSPSSPAPFPASVYVVQSLSRKHVEPRPAP